MMRWPLMFRSSHDALMAAKDIEAATLARAAEQWREAYQAVQARHDAFVGLVADRTAPPPKPAPVPKREPDAVDTAIEWVAGDDVAKRRYLERFAKQQRRTRQPDEIAAEIMAGARVSDDEDGVPQ